MKNKVVFFCLFFVLIACSKEKIADKKLNGDWSVDIVRIEDGEGFAFYDSIPTGSLHFDAENHFFSGQINYKYLNFENQLMYDTCIYETTTYNYLDSKADHISFLNNGHVLNVRFVVLTKKSMVFEYYDLNKYRLIRFIAYKEN